MRSGAAPPRTAPGAGSRGPSLLPRGAQTRFQKNSGKTNFRGWDVTPGSCGQMRPVGDHPVHLGTITASRPPPPHWRSEYSPVPGPDTPRHPLLSPDAARGHVADLEASWAPMSHVQGRAMRARGSSVGSPLPPRLPLLSVGHLPPACHLFSVATLWAQAFPAPPPRPLTSAFVTL